ncbi:MAG: 2-oxoacid:acceptor oxidoreductase family protein [Lachnospiraceae bacterium]|nr:2-oxoacid:acceptor oxidoreductase family protein [Lachnospiraceae bacterium]
MKEMVFSGFGGQGVLTAGLIIADVALAHDMYATWIPSYGAEMRGGKANCVVKVDNEQVGTPSLEEADILMAMNIPSLEFAERVKAGGTILCDSDFVADIPEHRTRNDVEYYFIPFNQIAREIGNARGSNVVAAGVVTALLSDMFDKDTAKDAMLGFFEDKGKGKFAEGNTKAFYAGYDYMKSLLK